MIQVFIARYVHKYDSKNQTQSLWSLFLIGIGIEGRGLAERGAFPMNKLHVTYLTPILMILGLMPNVAWSQFDQDLAQSVTSNVYNIQSTCASSGQYTAQALAHTRKIKAHLESLKNNAKCKGLPETLELSLNKMGERLEQIQASQGQMGNQPSDGIGFSSLGQQIMALRSFATNIPLLKGSVMGGLLKSVLQSQRLQSVAGGAEDVETDPKKKITQIQAKQILDAKTTARQAANNGLFLVNSTLDSFTNSYQDCLDDSANTAAYLASGMTQMLASFASTPEASMTGNNVAQAVNKVVSFLGRNKKYMTALRQLNETEFHSTLSCLIEMTTEGYCAVEDAQLLLNDIKKDYKLVEKVSEPSTKEKQAGGKTIKYVQAEAKNFNSLLTNGPMAGQYILTYQLPLVTDWVNKIQFGVEPQLPTEAQFQVQTFQTGLEPFTRMKQILGSYNAQLAQLAGIPDVSGKQNLVLDMLLRMSDAMTRIEGPNDNFFLRVHQVRQMPFALLGIAESDMPSEVFVPGPNNNLLDPIEYLQTRYRSMPQFKNPDALALDIKRNAEVIYNKAEFLAQQFFLQFFIPDEVAVVTESMVGMNKGDVRSALKNIDLYLKDFVERTGDKESGDAPFVVMALDMRKRIGHILARYKQMHEFGLELIAQQRQGKLDTKQMQERMIPMARDFIQDVYDQFFVKKMRAAWLSYRLNLLVRKDYSMAMQRRTFSDKNMQELLLATGIESLNQLFNQAGINIATAEIDLAQARSIYWSNISALEKIARAPMQNYINHYRLIADPNIVSHRDLWLEANKYSFARYAEKTPIDNEGYAWWRWTKGALNNVVSGLFGGFGLINPNVRYGWPSNLQEIFNTRRPDLTDGSNDDAQKIWAKNCALTLAFYDLAPYWYLCKKSTYYSGFYDESKYKNNKPVADFILNELSTPFAKTAYKHIENPKIASKNDFNRNRRARVCALREHYRKNYVVQLTAGLQRETEVYSNEFTTIIERPVIEEPSKPTAPEQEPVIPPVDERPEAPPAPGADGDFDAKF